MAQTSTPAPNSTVSTLAEGDLVRYVGSLTEHHAAVWRVEILAITGNRNYEGRTLLRNVDNDRETLIPSLDNASLDNASLAPVEA